MLKKAGIVVLGATAGMLSLAPLASAGEAPSHGGDHGNHGHHHDHDGDRGHRGGGGDCDKTAISSGNRLVSLDNLASNLDADNINVLSQDNSRDSDCGDGGGRGGHDGHDGHGHGGHGRDGGGDRTAISSGDRLISADNILANASLDNINVLSTDNSR
ncbi:hypothetical protein [Actinomycetospora sp. CA-053990]|uniref:hypothetical protein n=1 Tax=Actinomycetospora sp. CA-053990 TaxID=3239891 RepID=UPI003D92A183